MTQIRWNAACGGGPGGTCPASGSAGSEALSSQYDVYAADIDLVDAIPPGVSDVGGPLVAGGTLSGEQAVSFDAADGQSGVYGGSLVVDGKTLVSRILDSDEGRCRSLGVTSDGQRSFEYAQPCLPSLSASLTLDTGSLAPGPHTLELIVEDAAGNQTIGYDGTISVGGGSPSMGSAVGPAAPAAIGPGSPLALRGPANGTNASDEAELTARWVGARGVRAAKAVLTGRYGVRERVTGRLRTASGQPISGALLDVFQTPAYEGAKTVQLAGVRTGPAGAWTLVLPPGACSSTLRFVYRGHVNDTIPVASATLTLRVHAGIALRVAPRVASVGHTIVFSGVLHGGPIPPGGKQLVLEASSGGEWVEFDTLGTGAWGRFRASHRFRLPGPATYRFRVLSPYEADFPYLGGVSNVVVVRER